MATKKPVTRPASLAELASAGYRFDPALEAPSTEEPQTEPTGAMRRVLQDGGISLLKGAIGVPEAAVGLLDIPTGGRAGKIAEGLGFRPAEAKAILDEGYTPETKAALQKVQQAEGFVGKVGAAIENPSVIGTAVAESVPMMGAGGVVGRGLTAVAPRMSALVAGAAGEGITGAGSAAEQIRQQTADGLLTPEQSALAGLSGVGTAAFGVAGGKVAKQLGIGDVDTKLVQGSRATGQAAALEATKKNVVRKFLEGAVSEGVLEELPQSMQEQVLQNAAQGKPLDEGVDQAAALGLLSGMAMGGPAGALGHGGHAEVADKVRAEKLPEGGPMSRAVNAGIETTAKDVERGAAVPGLTASQENDALTRMEGVMASDQKDLKVWGSAYQPPPATASAVPGAAPAEGSAQAVDSPFADRVMDLTGALRDPTTRAAIEAKFGQDGFGQALYYLNMADQPQDHLPPAERMPERTRDRLLQLSEAIVSQAVLQPLDAGPAPTGARFAPPTDPALAGPDAQPRIGLDTAPTGTIRVDSHGSAAPETRADAISARQRSDDAAVLGTGVSPKAKAAPAPARLAALENRPTPTGVIRVDAAGAAKTESVGDAIQTRNRTDEAVILGKQAPRATATAPAPVLPPQTRMGALTNNPTPSGRMVAGPGGVRAETVAEVQARQRQKDADAEIGLTPDVRRAQQQRKGTDDGNADTAARGPGSGGVGGNADAGRGRDAGGRAADSAVAAVPGGTGSAAGQGSAGNVATGGADGALIADRWNKAAKPDREKFLAVAGWATGEKRGRNTEAVMNRAWDKMTDSQRARIGVAMESSNAAAPQPAAQAAPGQAAAPEVDPAAAAGEQRPAAGVPAAGRAGVEAAGVASPAGELAGKPINDEWTAFAKDSGTLAVPRAEMPQIRAEHRGAMVNFLAARGIVHEQDEVPASELKPTQAEFSPGKVEKAKSYEGGDRSILVSSDGHVLDGHHQWLARHGAGETVKVIRLDAPIKQLLETVKEFPSAQTAGGAEVAKAEPESQAATPEPAVEKTDEVPVVIADATSQGPTDIDKAPEAGKTTTVEDSSAPAKVLNDGETAREIEPAAASGAADPNDGERPAASRSEDAPAERMTVDEVRAAVQRLTAGWTNAPRVEVIEGMDDPKVPQTVRDEDGGQSSRDAAGEPEGFFFKGVAYLHAGHMRTEADVRRVLFHEALGHFGLRGLYGKALVPILDQIISARQKEVRAKAREYGLDANNRADLYAAAEEVLAEMAQSRPELGFVKRAISAVRAWLRSVGLKLRLSDDDIVAQFLLPARRFVEQAGQRGASDGKKAFSWGKTPEEHALQALSQNDDLFQLPKSDKDTVEGITAENNPDITVKRNTAIPGETRYNFTLPSGKTARMSVRKPNPYGGSTYGFNYADGELSDVLNDRPGENPEDVPPTDDVWIDVSLLESGDEGRTIYNIASTYAHNTGRIFIGDPAGLSDEAMRRRPELMLSSALKFGTTAHLAPHPRQVTGDAKLGIKPLKWVYGDDIGNIERLIDLNLSALQNAGLDAITYDTASGQFLDSERQPIDRAGITELAESGYGRSALAGGRTLQRAAVLNALSSEGRAARDRAGRDGAGILGGLLRESSVHPQSARKLFYSRAKSVALGDSSRVESAAFKRWFGDSKVVDADGTPLLVYHGTGEDFSVFQNAVERGGDPDFAQTGLYFAESATLASTYGSRDGGSVMPVYLNIRNPLDLTDTSVIEGWKGAIAKVIAPRMAAKIQREQALRDGLAQSLITQRERDRLIAAGYDGIKGAGGVWIAFKSEQIKSATGNRGTYDPSSSDIRFSRTQQAAQAAFDLKDKAEGTFAHYRGLGLQALGRRQLVDLYSGELPQLAVYSELVQQMDADKNEAGAGADQLATEWAKLKDEQQLAEVMHDATLARIDPAKPYSPGDDRTEWTRLHARFHALSDEAKATYVKARDTYQKHHDDVRQAITERIERSELSSEKRKRLLERMAQDFDEKVKGVYFPLARFGKYVVVVRDMTGNAVNVSRAETLNEANEVHKVLTREFANKPGHTVGKVIKDREFNAALEGVSKGFMADLYATLDKKGVDEDLLDAVGQLYLSALPDLAWAKHGIHRKGMAGFSQDARRAFAQNVFHGARYLAKLRYADQMQAELEKMQKHVQSKAREDDYDSVKAQQVVDEMALRHKSLMNPDTNPISTALTSFGFMFHMGLSPASAMTNLSGTALVAFPQMGARWGFGKASSALLAASKQTASNRNDISQALSGDELAAYKEAVRSGVIDVSMAHDLAGIAQGEDAKVAWKLRPVMKWSSFLFHHAERFNRQVTFVAAYRLSRTAGAAHAQAYAEAVKMTYDTHFDYSASNRPRLMQGNWQKVILLFKQYAQNMIYTLVRQAQQSLKGATPEARSEARKALGGILVMHGLAAGALGLPLVGMLLSAASMLGGDDDEPWDAKTALQNMLADTFGQKASEVMSHGLSRLTPWDISGRVGLDKLLLPDVQEGLEGQRRAEAWMAAALGPVAGIATGVMKGMEHIGNGRWGRGLEDMAPAALRGPLKAFRYGTEGAMDKSGAPIVEEVGAASVVGQALGLSPSEVRLATEGKSAIFKRDNALGDRRSMLLRQYAMAQMAGDQEGVAEVREAIKGFNAKNPTRRIKPQNMQQSVLNRRKRIEQSEQGVYLPKNRRDAMEAGQFAAQ